MEEVLKIALIHGDQLIDGIQKDGEIDELYTERDGLFHIALFINYFKDNYKDNEQLQSFTSEVSANKCSLALRKLGDVVFLNVTSYRSDMLEKHGKNCIFMMPDTLTEKQIESLLEFKNKISEYNDVQIWYDIDELGHANLIHGDVNIIDYFLENKKNKKK